MGKFFKFIITACAAGLVSYAFPRLLIALGMPLDVWVVTMGAWLGAPPDWINTDTAVWLFTLIFGFALFGIESLLQPAQKFWRFATRSSQSDSEIIQLRNDVKQLIDMLSDFSTPRNQRDDVYERMNRIKMSDHSVWLDNENLRLARKNFVHWCGVAQAWREQYGPTFRDTDDRGETLHYLNDAADRLDAGLKGNPVRNQQPYDQSGGE